MRITISERLRPFSHTPGVRLLIPGTSFEVQVFPAALLFSDLSGAVPRVLEQVSLTIKGLVGKFTVMQDLERGEVHVWGEGPEGYFRYALFAHQGAIGIRMEKSSFTFASSKLLTLVKEENSVPLLSRLSLGSHKAQDWDLVCRRCEMSEIFPIWHRLGQLVGDVAAVDYPPLETCSQKHKPEEILAHFQTLFKLGFRGLLSPTLQDINFQGIELPEPKHGSPLSLLKKGAELIGLLFVDKLQVLPALPPEFHCGRLLNVSCAVGTLDVEWTKKCIRQMILRPNVSTEVAFQFHRDIRSYRLRRSESDRGLRVKVGTPVSVEPSQHLLFDNFQT